MGQRRMHANRGDDEHDLRWLGLRHREPNVGGSTPLDLARRGGRCGPQNPRYREALPSRHRSC